MNTWFYEWLCQAEEDLQRMIRGIFRFVIEELPRRFCRFIVETVGPLSIRICRVLGLACLWLLIVFGPVWVLGFGGLLWALMSITWVVLALVGSVWGLKYAAKKRRAAEACPNFGSGHDR